MTHLNEEQLTQAYYGESAGALQHAEQCPECASRLAQLKTLLDSLRAVPVPERGSAYGTKVWTRVLPHLQQDKTRPGRRRWWMLIPAIAALLAIAFLSGALMEHRRAELSAQARERVLLLAMSSYLERSQVLLTELAHADPMLTGVPSAPEQARDLLNENYLLRESAMQSGNAPDAAVLDEIERVLLSVANGSSASGELRAVQQSIEDQDLLFKARITGMDAREKGQNL